MLDYCICVWLWFCFHFNLYLLYIGFKCQKNNLSFSDISNTRDYIYENNNGYF